MSRARKVIAAVLVLCLVFSCFTATAASKGVVYDSKTSDYTATKISHPDAGYGEVDGIIDWESGDGDRGQSYAWSAVGDGDYVYIGTCYAAIWMTIKTVGQMNPEMGLTPEAARAAANAAFNGKLYTGDDKNNPTDANHAVIVKINTKTGETKIVYDVRAEGYQYNGFRAAIKFNGKLYFCNTYRTPQIIEIDPKTDAAKVVYQCEAIDYDNPENAFVSSGIRGIAVYNDMLVVSAIREGGAYLVASKNPSEGQQSFKVVGTQQDLLDYPAYHFNDGIFGGSIFDMVAFNGKLYITVVVGRFDPETKKVPNVGFALFEAEEKDGKWTYNLIVGDPKDGAKYPYGFGGDRSGAANLVVHDNHLYVGAYNDPMVAVPNAMLQMDFESLYKDLSDPVSLWRMDTQGNWELVVGAPNEIFPEVKGNMGDGFDNPMNQYVWRMQDFDGKLYVGTFDVTGLVRPLAQFCNGDILNNTPKEWASQVKYIVELLKMFKKDTNPEAATYSTAVLSDADELVDTMKDMQRLLNKGGANDIKNSEKLHKLMIKAVKLYEKVRPILPEKVTTELDKVLNQEVADKLFYFIGSCKYLTKSEEGFDLLVTEDGINFKAISRDGLGDKFNHGVRTFAVNDNGLFLGTANPFFGTQVWHVEEKDAAAPDTEKNDNVVAPETEAPTTEEPKEEAPNTGVDTTSIAIASSALAAGVVLTLISKKKKATD